jgi:hypothetical protein
MGTYLNFIPPQKSFAGVVPWHTGGVFLTFVTQKNLYRYHIYPIFRNLALVVKAEWMITTSVEMSQGAPCRL